MSVLTDNTAKLRKILEKVENLPEMPPSVSQATPTISVSSGGLITATAAQEAGAVAAGTKSATRQLTTKGGTTITPGDAEQTAVSAGTYVTGDIKVAAASGGKSASGSITLRSKTEMITIKPGFMPTTLMISGVPNDDATKQPSFVYYANGSGKIYYMKYAAGSYGAAQVNVSMFQFSGSTDVNIQGTTQSTDHFPAATYYWVAAE